MSVNPYKISILQKNCTFQKQIAKKLLTKKYNLCYTNIVNETRRKSKMKEYVVYGEESGEVKSFESLKEAQKFIKELKRFDKENGIEDNYYIEVLEW